MEAVGKHGIQLQPGLVELFLLLFADDLALLSSTAMGLQNQLNHLNSVCKEHSLCINSVIAFSGFALRNCGYNLS